MRRIKGSLQAVMAIMVLGGLLAVQPGPAAAEADGSSLIISQLKITSHDGQFITLYNATDSAIDMGKYRLVYFNSYDLDKATSSKLIALSGTVPPHGYYMVNDDALLLCYWLTVDSASLGFSSTAGMVQVIAFDQRAPGGPVTPTLQDFAAWSKKDTADVQTLPGDTGDFLQRQSADGQGNPKVSAPGAGSWLTVHPDSDNPCVLTTAAAADAPTNPGRLLSPAEPPATIVSAESGPYAGLPPADAGLRAPAITELMPNPDGKGNDKTDEFIELYNSNAKPFDLSGFTLQTGNTRKHTYVFPSGSGLQPGSFKTFYSKETGLSLSNSGSRADLLDPLGRNISSSAEYAKAKDGFAWALAKGKWYWTVRPTPRKANVIQEPPSKESASGSGAKGKSGSQASGGSATTDTAHSEPASTPIHMRTLVLIATLALLYGAYEYRADLANGIYRIRQHFGARYEDRS